MRRWLWPLITAPFAVVSGIAAFLEPTPFHMACMASNFLWFGAALWDGAVTAMWRNTVDRLRTENLRFLDMTRDSLLNEGAAVRQTGEILSILKRARVVGVDRAMVEHVQASREKVVH